MRLAPLLLIGFALAAQQSPPTPAVQAEENEFLATIQGRVTDIGGNSIIGARVSFARSGARENLEVMTNERGEYRVGNVIPGSYLLHVMKDGYATGRYGASKPGYVAGAPLVVARGEKLTGVDIQLATGAYIAGTVRYSGGEPAPLAHVALFRLMNEEEGRRALPAGGVQADDKGHFKLESLESDTYFVAATPPSSAGRRHVAAAYHPSEATLATAAAVVVVAGSPVDGIEVRLRDVEVYAIRGRLQRGTGVVVNLWPSNSSVWAAIPRASAPKSPNNDFSFEGIERGGYELIATDASASRYARMHVDVNDRDVEELVLTTELSPAVAGLFTIDGAQKQSVPATYVGLVPLEMLPTRQVQAWSDEQGRYRIPRVVPGKYVVDIPDLPEGAIIQTLRWGGSELTGGRIDVAPGETRVLEVVLAFHGGSETGIVTDASGKPVSHAIVVTVPDGSGPINEIYAERTDESGTVLEQSLPPGKYFVLAFADLDPRNLTPAKMRQWERYAQKVEIQAGQRAIVRLKIVEQK